ncbi:PAS domain-containing protein [Arenibaculum sp.]|jgi:hypothetical protein|uniref:PAS domain-containing protein n=1 Tax=Arenibaculum sp. TaxID=2865862 RepID=UPI002E12CCFC|nr:PAS domain-containing protein [Arenibaculum sp.]
MDFLKDRRLVELCRYWAAKRRGGALPGRGDVDPMELRALLPHLFLLDVVRYGGGGLAYRYRLIGTALAELSGRDLTGETVSQEHYGADVDWILDTLGEVARTSTPVAQRRDMAWTGHRGRRVEIAFLPLASDGHTVNMILGGMVRTAETRRASGPQGALAAGVESLDIPWAPSPPPRDRLDGSPAAWSRWPLTS